MIFLFFLNGFCQSLAKAHTIHTHEEAWNCMSHLQTEGPENCPNNKDGLIKQFHAIMREAAMSVFCHSSMASVAHEPSQKFCKN